MRLDASNWRHHDSARQQRDETSDSISVSSRFNEPDPSNYRVLAASPHRCPGGRLRRPFRDLHTRMCRCALPGK